MPVPDVIIAGGGSAGAVLAARLSERPDRSVLLLEAGPDHGPDASSQPPDVRDAYHSRGTASDGGWESEPGDLGRSLHLFAGWLVGGSSATNNVMALRGQPADYDRWGDGWSFDSVLPSFRRVERDLDFGDRSWHGSGGPVPIRRYPSRSLGPVQASGVGNYQHPVGRCRLGAPDDPGAVVGSDGRVHGVEGLSVADASIMPTIPSANTNLPTMMVAEHIAAMWG